MCNELQFFLSVTNLRKQFSFFLECYIRSCLRGHRSCLRLFLMDFRPSSLCVGFLCFSSRIGNSKVLSWSAYASVLPGGLWDKNVSIALSFWSFSFMCYINY